MKRIKVFVLNSDEYIPDSKGLYYYANKKHTNKEFIHLLKKNMIWFKTYIKEVEE